MPAEPPEGRDWLTRVCGRDGRLPRLEVGIRAGKTLFGVGLLLATFGSLSFFLTQYGAGGVVRVIERPSTTRCSYRLYNQGLVTHISEGYYHLIEEIRSLEETVHRVAVPFILVGFLAYGTAVWRRYGRFHWRAFQRTLLPHREDPLLAFLAKTYFLLVLAALMLFGLVSEGRTEADYVELVAWTYGVLFLVSLAIAGGLQIHICCGRRRRAREKRAESAP